ncbi:MAG: hypothetical protein ACQERN_02095 [Thermodesulfobacteriota bacterium]
MRRNQTIIVGLILLSTAMPAQATQVHGAPEGLYAHQFSHLFFIFAMAILIYWLRSRRLVRDTGWRHIQYAAVFFIAWSVDAFFVHFMDEQMLWIRIDPLGPWRIQLHTPAGFGWLIELYYLMKLDHLLCVPALVFLYAGLRRLTAEKQDPAAIRGEGDKP